MDDAIGMLNKDIKLGVDLPKSPAGIDDNEWEARLDLSLIHI